jgi:cytidylate kinase
LGISVVTFSVQLGTNGGAIARAVAGKLEYRYYDREVLAQAASIAGVSPENVANAERWPGFFERMLEAMGRTSPFPGTLTGPPFLTMTSADYRGLIEYVVRELGKRGECVIVGHAAQAILNPGKSSIFKVLIHGSAEKRAGTLAWERGISRDDAREQIYDNDKHRLEFFEHVYKTSWLDASLYDLALNTDRLGVEQATSIVLSSISACSYGDRALQPASGAKSHEITERRPVIHDIA